MSDPSERQFDGLPVPVIHHLRGVSVLMDEDVAKLFAVTTARLNEQVVRNLAKFGDDFAFQLTAEEWISLKSQSATSNPGRHGGRRKPPRMFTEHGVVMAATVLRSERAVAASRFIIGVFVDVRRQQLAIANGRNLPVSVEPKSLPSFAAEGRHGLMAKLEGALGRVLDAIADPVAQTSVRDEARAIAAEGLQAIKEMLRKTGAQNEKTLAETHKLLKEAESIDAEIKNKHIEGQHRELAYVAKQLRIIIEVQHYLDTGSVEGLLATLKDLGGA
ncbi:ORF6N domain-containing protein [Azorhizobium sp. AG788]|uniref:ORF6N domain-containing protein n=1 Tax=Azorhizobium sp. AG788 TaxID=2183897 RepID=UPI00313A2C80